MLQVLTLLIMGFLDTTSSAGIWASVQSTFCIICCCAPVYRPLFPDRFWSHVASKISAYGRRLKYKRMKRSPGLQTRSWQPTSFDPYLQGVGHFDTEGYTGGTKCFVTSDARRDASHSDGDQPVGSIQVDRRVDVDYPTVYQEREQQMKYSLGTSRILRPSPPYLRALRAPPDI